MIDGSYNGSEDYQLNFLIMLLLVLQYYSKQSAQSGMKKLSWHICLELSVKPLTRGWEGRGDWGTYVRLYPSGRLYTLPFHQGGLFGSTLCCFHPTPPLLGWSQSLDNVLHIGQMMGLCLIWSMLLTWGTYNLDHTDKMTWSVWLDIRCGCLQPWPHW